ncbi:MAG TPA: lytic transglycosylase domain-containing protein [Spirochaetota bacterium]
MLILLSSCAEEIVFAQEITVELSNRSTKKKKRIFTFDSRYDVLIEKYSSEQKIDPFIIKCLIKVESDFNPNAVSSAGAVGLMQLMQETARDYGVFDRTNPENNIRAGVLHFSYLLKECKGEIPLALAAYHAGLGRVKRLGAIPPIQATIEYVNAVMTFYEGEGDYSSSVKTLYRIIEKDGTINITNR